MAQHIHIHLGSKVRTKDAADPQELIRKYGIVEHRLGAFTPNAPLREKTKTRAELDAIQKQLNALGYVMSGALGSTRWQKAKDASTETEDSNSSDLQHKIKVVKEKLEAAKKANAPAAERQALMKEYESLLNELRKSKDTLPPSNVKKFKGTPEEWKREVRSAQPKAKFIEGSSKMGATVSYQNKVGKMTYTAGRAVGEYDAKLQQEWVEYAKIEDRTDDASSLTGSGWKQKDPSNPYPSYSVGIRYPDGNYEVISHTTSGSKTVKMSPTMLALTTKNMVKTN